MMICRADFEELFPEISQPSETCVARWEDDGGRTISKPLSGPTLGTALLPQGDNLRTPDQTFEAFTTMPAAVAYGAA